jgi:hypothetical protein
MEMISHPLFIILLVVCNLGIPLFLCYGAAKRTGRSRYWILAGFLHILGIIIVGSLRPLSRAKVQRHRASFEMSEGNPDPAKGQGNQALIDLNLQAQSRNNERDSASDRQSDDVRRYTERPLSVRWRSIAILPEVLFLLACLWVGVGVILFVGAIVLICTNGTITVNGTPTQSLGPKIGFMLMSIIFVCLGMLYIRFYRAGDREAKFAR